MKRSLLALVLSSSAAAAIAACSAAPDSGGLGTSHYGNPATSSSSGGSSSGGSSGGSGSSSGGTASSSSGGSSSGGGSGSSSGTQAPPDAGPGSTSSAAHQYFNATVYPELSVCQGCHATGTDGAPKMMDNPADQTYSELDARGLIVANSLILTQGVHDSSKAPALSSQQQSDVTTWLNMEAQERVGTAAPVNVLAEIANCADETEWNNIGWKNLKTVPRTGTNAENPNKCTGCNNDPCRECHEGGEANFFMAEGSNLQPAGTTFHETFYGSSSQLYVTRFFGLNGTTPVASNAIMTKMQAVAVGPAYSHPMFVMSQTMQTALNTFVNDAITKYTATGGKCTPGSSSDAGLGGD